MAFPVFVLSQPSFRSSQRQEVYQRGSYEARSVPTKFLNMKKTTGESPIYLNERQTLYELHQLCYAYRSNEELTSSFASM